MQSLKLEGDRDKAQLAAERDRFAQERAEYEVRTAGPCGVRLRRTLNHLSLFLAAQNACGCGGPGAP